MTATVPAVTVPAVTVAICTFRRNDAMAALVRRIGDIAASELPGGSVRVLVVDDSPEGGAAATVDELRHDLPITVDYAASASADIAVARNRALALALALSDSTFVACVDDDCVPQSGWLRELLRVAQTHNADVVVGHRQFIAQPGAPKWLHDQPFLLENLIYADGSVPTRGNTANMLVRSSWLQSSGVRFRTEMGEVGGEDMVFFADATNAQANIRFAAGSTCDEPCDGRRARFRYQLWRQLWLGNNAALINRATAEVSRARLLARGVKQVLRGPIRPIARLLRRKSPQLRWAIALIANGAGVLLGVAGLRIRHRS